MAPSRRRAACAPRAARRGFTLVEVLVALAVSAVVLLGARALFESVSDGTERIVAASNAAARMANGQRLLRQLVSSIEVGGRDTLVFEGAPAAAHFSTWCPSADGWLVRCAGDLHLAAEGDSAIRLTLGTTNGDDVQLTWASRSASLLYLERADNGGVWTATWPARVVAPLAIGVALDRDTVIVRVRARG